MSKTMLIGALVASVAWVLSLACSAEPEHGDEAHGADDAEHSGAHAGHGVSTPQVARLADAWTALAAARDAIAGDIESGALGDVHANAESLPGLVAAMLEQSRDLEPGNRARVEGAAKQLGRVADALHVAADRGAADRTRSELTRLNDLLELIRVQYPVGALEAGMHGHENHTAAPGSAHAAAAHWERPAGIVDAPPQATVRIRAFDQLRFEPQRIEVRAGIPTRIELENTGAAEHSLVVKTPDGEQDWVHLHVLPGASAAATYQFDEPGTYLVLCTITGHTEGGMNGELVVLADPSHAPSHP
jgi:plastocyanin